MYGKTWFSIQTFRSKGMGSELEALLWWRKLWTGRQLHSAMGTETTFVLTPFLMSWLGGISRVPRVRGLGKGYECGGGRSHCPLCLTLSSSLLSFWCLIPPFCCAWVLFGSITIGNNPLILLKWEKGSYLASQGRVPVFLLTGSPVAIPTLLLCLSQYLQFLSPS